MTGYEELVKALRCKSLSKKCDSCGYGYHLSPDSECNDACHVEQIYEDAAAAIEELQAQLPKRGEWIDRYDEDDKPFFKRKYVCSACGHWNTYGKSKYCPKCGAKMEVQE